MKATIETVDVWEGDEVEYAISAPALGELWYSRKDMKKLGLPLPKPNEVIKGELTITFKAAPTKAKKKAAR